MTAFGHDQLHVERTGPDDGPPVVLLHGWGSSAQLMQPLAAPLADTYRVHNLDLPGHGLTPPPPEPWGVPEYAALVVDYVREVIGRPAALVGHSNGGRIGLYIASDPDTADVFDRMALVSPSGITPQRTWQYHAKRTFAKTLKAPFEVLPEPLRGHTLDWLRHSLVWKALGSSDYRQLQGVMRETFVRTVNCHLDDRVGRIDVPVLLLWGDADPAISRHQIETLEARIPDAGVVVLEGAGHYGYLDDPDTTLGAVRYFLDHTGPDAAPAEPAPDASAETPSTPPA